MVTSRSIGRDYNRTGAAGQPGNDRVAEDIGVGYTLKAGGTGMNRLWINFWLAAAAFLDLLALGTTGLLLRYLVPPGRGRGGWAAAEPSFFWLHRHDWRDLHFYFAAVFLLLAATHLLLHWKWISCRLRELRAGRRPPEKVGPPDCGGEPIR
jgi:hypothetical protein